MRHCFFTILLIVTITFGKANAQHKVFFSNNYPPYNYVNEQNELVGFNIDILNAIKNLYGTEITIGSNEWK